MSSDAVLERLTKLHPKKIDLSLGRIERLLERLDHPERKLAPVIHVAGTNGKGSVIQFMRRSLEATGKVVHSYTSPHLIKFHERIRLGRSAGQSSLIAEPQLAALLEECETANGGEPITFFEITTAAALLAFARTPADAVILEVGLGGRLDATNVIERPTLTVITPVSVDHVAFLGSDLAGIAREKAGILKKGVTGVIGPQPPEALAAIAALAKEIGAPLVLHERDWTATISQHESDKMHVKVGTLTYERLSVPTLLGRHQVLNGGLAVAAIDSLKGFAVGHGALSEGMREAQWPARLQQLTGKLLKNLNDNTELWLDGAHNPGAAEALAQQAKDWQMKDGRPLVLIVGMLDTKDATNFFKPLAAVAKAVVTLDVPNQDASAPAKSLALTASKLGMMSKAAKNLLDALERAAQFTDKLVVPQGPPTRVLICGSLYLAGHVLEADGKTIP